MKLYGIFSIHGSDHAVVAQVHIEMSGTTGKEAARWRTILAWRMKNPSNFLLKVKPLVNAEVETGRSIQVAK
jgi:hypothetical protein